MLANWIHVMIVHLIVIGVPWLLYRVFIQRKEPLDSPQWKNTYSFLILSGVIAAIAYFTGPTAADWTKLALDPYPQEHVEDHALWGRVAFVIQVVVALIGIMGWASILQDEKPDKKIFFVLIVLLLINTSTLFYTAHLGGFVRRMDLLL